MLARARVPEKTFFEGLLLETGKIDHSLIGGWAVDFHAGRITRNHADLDFAVWRDDMLRMRALLECNGWRHRRKVRTEAQAMNEAS
jgi:hypothetical protein